MFRKAPEHRDARVVIQAYEGRIDLRVPVTAFGRGAFREARRDGAIMFAEHDIDNALIFREAVLQGDRFGQHLDALDGVTGEVGEFHLARQVPIDEHDGHSIAAAAAGQEFKRIDQIAKCIRPVRLKFRRR